MRNIPISHPTHKGVVKRIHVNIINNICHPPLGSTHNLVAIGNRSNTEKLASGKDVPLSITTKKTK